MENNDNTDEMSLPGERQGTAGASAGRDRVQVAGGVSLNRRAHAGSPELATADDGSLREQRAATAESVSRTLLGTTQAGLPRRRIQWNDEMNENIIRLYLRITRCETVRAAYRQELHARFTQLYPHLSHLTEQNVADRRALLYRSENYVSQIRKQQIKDEIHAEFQLQSMECPQTPSQDLESGHITPILTQPNRETESNGIEDSLSENLKLQYQLAKTEFEGLDPCCRPRVPKQNNSRKLALMIKAANEQILPYESETIESYRHLDSTIYCMAVAIVRMNGAKMLEARQSHNCSSKTEPPWKRRLAKKIEVIRADIAVIEAFQRGSRSKRMRNKISNIKKKHRKHAHHNVENRTLTDFADTLKQQLRVYSQRLRRYSKSLARREDNRDFIKNQKTFYRRLAREEIHVDHDQIPEKSVVEEFWSNVWSTENHFNGNASWLPQMDLENIAHMQTSSIVMDILKDVMRKLHNWKCPGVDGLHNFWFKRFTSLHTKILEMINFYLQNPEEIPSYLCEGKTFMIPKAGNSVDPSKFRPITCLNSFYKIITSCLLSVIEQHCLRNKIIAEAQKGCCKGSMGCREQLIIDSVIMTQASKKARNLYTCFIDYQKAFDMVPHDWLISILTTYRINPIIVHFLKTIMKKWCTTLNITANTKTVIAKTINIKRGIFQGDSLSPYWFCLAMNPLSTLLDKNGSGFELKGTKKQKVTHLAYMDDIKLYSSSRRGLEKLLEITEMFSNDIGMHLGTDKCKIQSVRNGKLTNDIEYETVTNESITAINLNEFYKYLGIQQSLTIPHTQIKEELKFEFERRLKAILKTYLNSKNLTTAINTYAIPVLTYSMGIVKWSKTDIEAMERSVRVQMTRYRCHHPRGCTQRVTLPRGKGGRGIVNISNLHIGQITALREYFKTKAQTSLLHEVVQQADDNFTPLNLRNNVNLQQSTVEEEMVKWKQKALHGAYPAVVANENVDVEMSYKWLTVGYLYPETEGLIIAIQDQVIPTKNYLKYIIKDPAIVDDNCRMCGQGSETIQHILSGCSVLAPSEYKLRHDNIGRIIHGKLAVKYGLLQEMTPFYRYHPQTVLENDIYKLYWDRSILTDKTVQHNRPDITIWDRVSEKVLFVDFAVVGNNNIMSSYQKKLEKYRELAQVVKEEWSLKCVKTIPIVLSAAGIVPRVTTEAVEELGINKNVLINMQKAVVINTCSMVRRFLGTIV